MATVWKKVRPELFWGGFLLFSHSVVSNSLQPHRPQHARTLCPSPSPRTCSNSCPLSRWCHPTISSSVTLFFFCSQSFPASGSFRELAVHRRWPNYWSFSSASVPPMNIQGWFPLGLTDLIFLLSKGLSRTFSSGEEGGRGKSKISLWGWIQGL